MQHALIALRPTTLLDGSDPVQTVDARELHAYLGVDSHFKDWVARRLATYGFVEGQDFRSFLSETGGRPAKEYQLTLDTAKELAMVERTARGREARRYFIECEKRLRAAVPAPVPVLATTASIGDSPLHRRDVARLCFAAAKVCGVSVHRVHGAIRRACHAPGVYQVPLALLAHVLGTLDALLKGELLLPSRKRTGTVLALLPGGKAARQQEMFS